MSQGSFDYKKAGVDIDTADAAKEEMKAAMAAKDPRVLNSLGAFASLYDLSKFPGIKNPVLVMKMEEPGSKQLLAAQEGRLASVGLDLIHHVINDTVVMGAKPLAIQDSIICGKLEKDMVVKLVATMAAACRENGCDLVGGETSEQPRVLPAGSYILNACCVGIVDRDRIVDGSKVVPGQVVLAVASNGVHTNGYTLVRSILDANPNLRTEIVGGEKFIDAVLKPHLCYNLALQELFGISELPVTGLAHITGGGIVDNFERILPETVAATLDLSKVSVLPVFSAIKRAGNVPEQDMLRTFNLGVGLCVVVSADKVKLVSDVFRKHQHQVYPIGETMRRDSAAIKLIGKLNF